MQEDSVYYWSDNWHIVYTNWASGQPNKTETGGCVSMDDQGGWLDVPCTEGHKFMCKTTTCEISYLDAFVGLLYRQLYKCHIQ